MTLLHWNTAREMDGIRQELDRAFDRTFGFSQRQTTVAPLQLWETAEAYVARLSVPGVDAESLQIEAGPYGLTVAGKVEFVAPDGAEMLYSEFNGSSFSRQFKVPTQIDTEAVTADFDGGILTVTLPKVSTSRVVKVTLAGARADESEAEAQNG